MGLGDDGTVRRRRVQQVSGARQLWSNYKVELIGLVLAGAGLFLLFEQLNLRKSVATWSRTTITGLFSHFRSLDKEVAALLSRVSLSDVVGGVLLVGALAAILLRLRWRLMNAPRLTGGNCPKCGGLIHRVHRQWYDRLISLYVPVRRYRCHDAACGWKGLRVGRHHASVRRRSPSIT